MKDQQRNQMQLIKRRSQQTHPLPEGSEPEYLFQGSFKTSYCQSNDLVSTQQCLLNKLPCISYKGHENMIQQLLLR
ncbi:hypothetical protein T01_1211 [Trichinella spiralis]|uniref:Uncharacterized protein n=1 Tax=Trichinella spiralis TaxID=6334 RepID=A0A0V0Z6L3_TRISP|nr:hypothetical protein T01_1211 [Trichinella spiralis]